eukprot:CAMPEP_0172827154 /NCGR_PEP_ID=MMETSP1075-20121228/19928_1 /TAXON_ID=2916 /ORGANISM="Ceratium fusus, Strain PA161109" /LENGTH=215 /DNA_ID=CAMNT_0013668929 /DNA_START=132 /DNA_END=779 /DNA_ORIENTATION=+
MQRQGGPSDALFARVEKLELALAALCKPTEACDSSAAMGDDAHVGQHVAQSRDHEQRHVAEEANSEIVEIADKGKAAADWCEYEAHLIDQAVDVLKQHCRREAANQHCETTVSFEVLARKIEGFPKCVLQDSVHVVDSWGNGQTAASWLPATRGPTASWSPESPIPFAEVLQGMLPKFVGKARSIGLSCIHVGGTWKVTVTWRAPLLEWLRPGNG